MKIIIAFFLMICLCVVAKSQTSMDSIWAPKMVQYNGVKYQLNFFVNHTVAPQTTPNRFHYYPAKCKVYRITPPGLVLVKMVPAKWPDGPEAEVRAQTYDLSKLVIEALKP